jgi:TP901 family phage tail tape measure protein
MAKIGTAYVDIAPDLSSLTQQTSAFFGGSQWGSVGKKAAAGLGAIAVGAGAAGKALYDIGAAFDDASDTIRVKTGATGKELKKLEGAFTNVIKSVPTDFESASQAVAGLNQRLGLTGKPLRDMSKQVLELSRITETDLNTNIQAVSRTFGDWGIAVKDQGPALDMMFRASQETGIEVSRLGEQMVKFGAPLRQMGFGFEETAGLLGKFEEEGVNAELVMGSLRIALGRMAAEGVKDPAKALQQITKDIQNAGTAGKANALALETFGARAGPDMAAAIREGRFELGDLMNTIKNGKETIRGAGKDTMDFDEQWTLFKNNIMVALKPAAEALFKAVGDGMEWLRKNGPAILATVKGGFNDVKVALSPLIQAIGEFLPEAFQVVKDIVEKIWPTIERLVKIGLDNIKNVIKIFTGIFKGDFGAVWDAIKGIFRNALEAIKTILRAQFSALKAIGKALLEKLVDGLKALPGALRDAGKWMLEKVTNAIQAAPGLIRDAAAFIKNTLIDLLKGFVNAFLDAGHFVLRQIVEGIKGAPDLILDAMRWVGRNVLDLLKSVPENLAQAGVFILRTIKEGLQAVPGLLGDIASWLGRTLLGAIREVAGAFLDIGGKIIGWIGQGIKDGFTAAVDAVKGFINEILKIVNKIPGVDIGLLATGGKFSARGVEAFAQGGITSGGYVDRPIVVMGEDAPKHPEYVIPTNPAYRGRAHELLGQAARAVGFAKGGLFRAVYGRDELISLWRGVGGSADAANTAAAIAFAESSGNPNAVNYNDDGSVDRGLWQINSIHGALSTFDPTGNAQAAKTISGNGSNWNPWVAYTSGKYLDFLSGGGNVGTTGGGVGGMIKDLVGKLPSPAEFLPDWMAGFGKWAIDKVTGWMKDQISSLGGVVDIGGGGGIVTLGRLLQRQGYEVSEHPAFGGVGGGHDPDGYHYVVRAIDVNDDPWAGPIVHGSSETESLTHLYNQLKEIPQVVELLWQVAGHYDHLHVAMHDGGWVGSGPVGKREMNARLIEGEYVLDPDTAAAVAGKGGTSVKVYIDGREFKGIVRSEIYEYDRAGRGGLVAAR